MVKEGMFGREEKPRVLVATCISDRRVEKQECKVGSE
jgi:hypothetical protein